MANYKLIGQNYTTTDLRAKVTGQAKYAEDFRAEGMVFMKLLLSPMPHARVRRLDADAALAMPGVEGIITADDLPEVDAPNEAGLTNEPLYEKLDEGKLFNTGINLLYQRTLENSKQLILIGVSELASNEFSLNRFAGRHYISGMLTRKPNERVRWGYGGVVNYALGVWNVYPTLLYHRQLRDKWLLELNLPGNAQLRFHPDNKTHIIAKLAFDNWRYNVTDALQDGSGQFTLQRADIYGGLMLEKQLYDWLWLAGEVSYLSNLSFFVAEPGERLRNAVEEFKVDDSTQLKFSLFLVPPQKLWSGIKAR